MKGALLFLLGWVALLLLYQHISLYARSLTHTYIYFIIHMHTLLGAGCGRRFAATARGVYVSLLTCSGLGGL